MELEHLWCLAGRASLQRHCIGGPRAASENVTQARQGRCSPGVRFGSSFTTLVHGRRLSLG
eukprot:2283610-Rhodomonas_salina.1